MVRWCWLGSQIPTAGLYQKFEVRRIVGEDKPGQEFFVLSPTHDPMAIAALRVYAEVAEANGLHELADQLSAGLDRCEKGIPFYE